MKEDTMIKIFATDMDGSLLDTESRLPEDIEALINRITEQNKVFIAASGRTLTNLEHKFKDTKADISYISDNGAVVKHKGELLYVNKLDPRDVTDTINAFKKAIDSTTVVITPTMAYIDSEHEEHHKFLVEYYTHLTLVDNLLDYTEDVIKITAVSPHHSHDNFVNHINGKLNDNVYAVEAGHVWIDVMNIGVNKGVALQYLMDILDVKHDEVASFGDYYNDLELIQVPKYGYVLENAPDDIKELAYEVIGSNSDNSVYLKIEALLSIENTD